MSKQPLNLVASPTAADYLTLVTFCHRRNWYIRNNLLLGFCISSVAALAWPLPGQVLYAPAVRGVHVIPFLAVAIVFFISGLTLKTDELRTAFTKRAAVGKFYGMRVHRRLTACPGSRCRETCWLL